MNIEIILIAVLICLAIAFGETLPKKYRIRRCEGRAWKDAFPTTPKNEIREFLTVFTYAFAFKEHDKLRFRPDDRLLDIYNQLYPCKWQADALEFETLAGDLKIKYDASFEDIWHNELTLGELFLEVNNA
tara:strand:+ start:123 stop:512 length:390 start_codon:yes stop_codon:yes gene_type:complete